MVEQRYFEDFRVGDRFVSHPRTITDAHFSLFAGLSGDNHPLHYDAIYGAQSVFGRPVAPGLMLTSLTSLGNSELSYQLLESMIAMLEEHSRYLQPVFAGDSLRVAFEVAEVSAKGERGIVRFDSSITNQRGETVLQGSHTYMLKCRAPS